MPGCTEIACALGLADQLLGRSHECDFPPAVQALPVCTAPRLSIHASSGEIDREVKSLLQEALSIYCIDAEMLKRLRPDVILTQSQCEVCAVSLPEVEQAVGGWLDSTPHILSLAPKQLADVWNDILRVGAALGAGERGHELVRQLRSRAEAIGAKSRAETRRPSVACLEWLDPTLSPLLRRGSSRGEGEEKIAAICRLTNFKPGA